MFRNHEYLALLPVAIALFFVYAQENRSVTAATSAINFTIESEMALLPAPSSYDHLVQIHVDVGSGSDDNPGTKEAPLKTLSEGLNRAVSNRANGISSRILLHPGTYREGIDRFYDDNRGPLIVVQALKASEAVISGSDIWEDWRCDASLCTHTWPHQWGAESNPWPEVNLEPLGLRREMIFVNGKRLEQFLSLSEVRDLPGSFYVDEDDERVHMHLPQDTDISTAVIEVAVRPRLFWTQGLHDLAIEGLVFQHAASPVATSAVYIVDQNNVLIEDVLVQQNNWDGLAFAVSSNITLRNSIMNDNGASGTGAWQVKNMLVEDNETSYNNWRGSAGGLHGWAIGQKFMLARNLMIRRHTSTNNLARGLWLDWDVQHTVLDEVYSCGNRNDGIFIEASKGPITVRNSTFCDNGRSGILTSATHDLTLENNVIRGNERGQINLSGSFDLEVTDFVTQERYILNNENWLWRNNMIVATGDQPLISTTFPEDEWELLMNTSELDLATYSATFAEVFQVPGGSWLTFKEWQRSTGQDNRSVFNRLPTGVNPAELARPR